MMTKAHCLRNFPFQLKPVNMKCKLRTKTVDYGLAQLSALDHKLLNDEAHSEDQYVTTYKIPWILQHFCGGDSLIQSILLHRNFHSWFPRSKVSRIRVIYVKAIFFSFSRQIKMHRAQRQLKLKR